MKSINLFKWPDVSWDSTVLYSVLDRIDRIILIYKLLISIISIKQNIHHIEKFSFRFVTLEDVRLIIKDLKNNKAAAGDILLKLLQECNFTYEKLTNCINNSLSEGLFLDYFERANITPVLKKNDPLDKENYMSVSILHLLSIIHERAIFNQLSEYVQKFLNKILCGFRKAHNTQHALFKLLQAWQKEFDNSGHVGTILTDLSKGYDCIPHDFLIAKLEVYDLNKISFL